jgi:CHAP domain-containing protein/LysM domain-containing protein
VNLTRLAMHAVFLIVSMFVAGLGFAHHGASAGRSLRPIAARAAGISADGGVELGWQDTIIKPVAIPLARLPLHSPIHHTVVVGDTVAGIARSQDIPEAGVRWSNLGQLARLGSEPAIGSDLLVPPVAGIAMVSSQGDTIDNLADRFHVDAVAIADFNRLRFAADDPLPSGLELVVPGGRGPDLAPASSSSRPTVSFHRGGYTILGPGTRVPVAAGNDFAFGNCTYYVYNRRQVPWQGDAWAWYGNAQRMGFATGSTPRPGSIMVTWESGYGHVAYVESVNADGSWIVSEMNFVAFNAVDRRLIRPGGVPLMGFIY